MLFYRWGVDVRAFSESKILLRGGRGHLMVFLAEAEKKYCRFPKQILPFNDQPNASLCYCSFFNASYLNYAAHTRGRCELAQNQIRNLGQWEGTWHNRPSVWARFRLLCLKVLFFRKYCIEVKEAAPICIFPWCHWIVFQCNIFW